MAKTYDQLLADAKSQIKEYAPAEVKAMQERGESMVLLDCRDPNEAALGRIPGAIHISRGRLESNVEAAIPRSSNVIIYCANGNRSAFAAVTLREMGYEHVASMSAGFTGWTAIGGDVE